MVDHGINVAGRYGGDKGLVFVGLKLGTVPGLGVIVEISYIGCLVGRRRGGRWSHSLWLASCGGNLCVKFFLGDLLAELLRGLAVRQQEVGDAAGYYQHQHDNHKPESAVAVLGTDYSLFHCIIHSL